MAAGTRQRDASGPWAVEFDALAKATGGAVLFGIPLLFTMEMWWIGEFQPRLHLLGFIFLAFVANIAFARMSGFRPDYGSWSRDVAEAVEALAIGVVLSVVILLALGQIDGRTSAESLFGIVAVQVIPLSLGATVGNLVFDTDMGRTGDAKSASDDSPLHELLSDVAATFAGALFIGFAMAPTEEIPMLASGLTLAHVIGIVAFTMIASYLIVFASGFDPAHRGDKVGGLFQRPFSETVLAYVVSLVASLALLYGFGQVAPGDPLHSILVQVIVLAVPASIGGAAGRVVV